MKEIKLDKDERTLIVELLQDFYNDYKEQISKRSMFAFETDDMKLANKIIKKFGEIENECKRNV